MTMENRTAPPTVWCIVLAYNGIELTLECLATLRHQDYPHLHLLVVDNASNDGTAEVLRHQAPDVELLEAPENLGYAGGNNLGMRHALANGAELLFLINNDTRLDPHCVTALVEEIQKPPICGAVGPMVIRVLAAKSKRKQLVAVGASFLLAIFMPSGVRLTKPGFMAATTK